jgi:hypothetical protein
MPAGTKPYPCGHPGCDWSFALKHQLKAHEKTHDRESSGICPPSNRNHSDLYALATRYTCSHPAHDDTFPAFPTWSALQAHLHTAHPPTCPHPECSGRTFKSTQRLREHLQVHEDREADIRSRKEQSGKGKRICCLACCSTEYRNGRRGGGAASGWRRRGQRVRSCRDCWMERPARNGRAATRVARNDSKQSVHTQSLITTFPSSWVPR